MSWLKGKKTYLVLGLMVLVSLIDLITGEIGLAGFFHQPRIKYPVERSGVGHTAFRSGRQPMTFNLGTITLLMVTGLSVFFWVYRRGKAAVLLDGAQDELKKIKRIQESSGAIDAETKN